MQYQIGQDQEGYTIQNNLFFTMPKRQISNIKLNQSKHTQLLDLLTCKLCLQVLNTPIYLRCSHRFCKDCIEKYLRNASNKCCPLCRQPVLSKRQARIDNETINFMNLYRKYYRQDEENKYCNQASMSSVSTSQTQNLQSIDSSFKHQANTSSISNIRKSSKSSNQSRQIIKSKKSNHKSKIIQLIDDQINETIQMITISSNHTQKENDIQIIQNISSKGLIPFVLQEQESYYQSQEQSIYQKQQQTYSNMNTVQYQNTHNSQSIMQTQQIDQQQLIKQNQCSTITNKNFQLKEYYFKQVSDIQLMCKNNNKNAYFQIILQPFLNKIVPQLQKQSFLCPFDIKISNIKKIIANQFNISTHKVKLYIMNGMNFDEISQQMRICDINNKFWKENMCILSNLSMIIDNFQNVNKNKKDTRKIIYYFIIF